MRQLLQALPSRPVSNGYVQQKRLLSSPSSPRKETAQSIKRYQRCSMPLKLGKSWFIFLLYTLLLLSSLFANSRLMAVFRYNWYILCLISLPGRVCPLSASPWWGGRWARRAGVGPPPPAAPLGVKGNVFSCLMVQQFPGFSEWTWKNTLLSWYAFYLTH